MNIIRFLFWKTRIVWLIGIPLFTLVFFFPYWFFLCPIIWRRRQELAVVNSAWNSPWLYGYWLVSAFIWALLSLTAIFCCKSSKQSDYPSSWLPDEFLLRLSRSNSDSAHSVPIRLTEHRIQPRKDADETVHYDKESKIEFVSGSFQPPLKCLPPSRLSEIDFAWEEDIPWLSGGSRMTTFRSKLINPPSSRAVMQQVAEDSSVYQISEPDTSLASKEIAEIEDDVSPFELLSVEYPSEKYENYFHLTPAGTPSKSPSPSRGASVSTLDVEDLARELELFNQVAQELKEKSGSQN